MEVCEKEGKFDIRSLGFVGLGRVCVRGHLRSNLSSNLSLAVQEGGVVWGTVSTLLPFYFR